MLNASPFIPKFRILILCLFISIFINQWIRLLDLETKSKQFKFGKEQERILKAIYVLHCRYKLQCKFIAKISFVTGNQIPNLKYSFGLEFVLWNLKT